MIHVSIADRFGPALQDETDVPDFAMYYLPQ